MLALFNFFDDRDDVGLEECNQGMPKHRDQYTWSFVANKLTLVALEIRGIMHIQLCVFSESNARTTCWPSVTGGRK